MLNVPLTILLVVLNLLPRLCLTAELQAPDRRATVAPKTAATAAPALKAIPVTLHWKNQPADWNLGTADELTIVSARKTNWFVNPLHGRVEDNLPLLLFKPDEEFVLTAKVKVGFKASWDAGGLVVRSSDEVWGKFCFESSVKKEPMVVSVVTHKYSDDCNSMVIAGDAVYYRLAKVGQAIFFYASEDGRVWNMVRSFTFGPHPDLEIGFFSQSPVGEGCTAVFSEIAYSPTPIKNLFEGQ